MPGPSCAMARPRRRGASWGELVDPPRQRGLARDGGVEALLNDAIAKTRNSAVESAV